MKLRDWIVIATAVVVVLLFAWLHHALNLEENETRVVKVGFVYEGDESTPYSHNFMLAQRALETAYGERAETYAVSNVPYFRALEAIRGLAEKGCELIFVNSVGYEAAAKQAAEEFPEVQICQAAGSTANTAPVLSNFHTFMGEISQGRYISGLVAGLKLKELLDTGVIAPEEAKLGYVGAIPCAEVISGYTAFLLGVRSVVPQAVMTVRYTNTWSGYDLEKRAAEALIGEGCVILSQHSDTIGPAVACEAAAGEKPVYLVGYNQSMMDAAPTTALVSCRINWTPYVLAAFEAVLAREPIEKHVQGHVSGRDAWAGFQRDWVQMVELNEYIAAPGTREAMEAAIEDMKAGRTAIFKGPYIGVDPEDPTDTVDLTQGYGENRDSSAPTFHYILKDIITLED
jgi:basic membrane protein A